MKFSRGKRIEPRRSILGKCEHIYKPPNDVTVPLCSSNFSTKHQELLQLGLWKSSKKNSILLHLWGFARSHHPDHRFQLCLAGNRPKPQQHAQNTSSCVSRSAGFVRLLPLAHQRDNDILDGLQELSGSISFTQIPSVAASVS